MSKKQNKFEPVGEHVSIFKIGRTWYYNHVDDTGRQVRRSLRTTNKRTAQRKAAEIETQLREGNGPTYIKAASVDDAVRAYLAFLNTEGRSKKTLVKYEYIFNLVASLCEQLHIHNLMGLDFRFLDRFRQMRTEQGRAPKTVYTESVVIRQLIKFSVTRKMLKADTMAGYKLKKPKSKEQPHWTEAEINRILENSVGMAKTCFEILWMTGMRVGELCHLEWSDVDLKKGTIQIRPKDFKGIDKSGKHVKGHWNTKNGEQRIVPMSLRLKEVLSKLPHVSNWVVTRPPCDGKNPRQMSDRWLLAQVKQTLKKLGIKGHIHTFRHSFVSHALVVGKVPQDVVRQWVGHIDSEILKNYTHVSNDASKDYMAQMYDEKDSTGQNGQSSGGNTDDAA